MSFRQKQIREIRVIDLLTYVPLPLFLAAGLWGGVYFLRRGTSLSPYAVYIAAGVISYLLLKRFFIGTILLYKAFAPMRIRNECRFVPTCSTYMILAVQKYGLLIGTVKGILRLFRCHPPNGGEDYP